VPISKDRDVRYLGDVLYLVFTFERGFRMTVTPDSEAEGTDGTVTEDGRRARVGYVPGVFDMFHIGHLNILRQARLHCDHLIAGVVSDEKALAAKGRLPVVPLVERVEILRHCTLVDEVVAEVVSSKVEQWEVVRFDVIFKGDDWRGTPKGEELERDLATVGVEVVYFPYTIDTSSTLLRDALQRGRAS
jgi:glycerol-3-phosphate cytidylyltransferase